MAILLTGGSGFVGLNVAELLLRRGEDVILFGPTPPPQAAMRALVQQSGNLHVFVGDVREGAQIDAAFAAHRIDRVIHAAAITADISREHRAPRDIFTVNLLGTVEVLEAAMRHGVRRVVQIGTGSIFGAAGTATPMLDEVTSLILPETLYGVSKFAAERTGLRYRQTRALDLVVARLGMVFGRWEYDTGFRDTLSLPLQLLFAAEAGRQVVISSATGDDWVYASDVASGLVALLEREHLPEPIYHVSSGMRWSVDAWCRLLQRRFPAFRYEISDDPGRCTIAQNGPRARSPLSIERMRRDVGYEPQFFIERAFADMMEWRSRVRPELTPSLRS